MRWFLPDHASLQSRGYSQCFVNITGKHSCCQAVVCGVGSLDDLMDATETHDLLHWTKNLREWKHRRERTQIIHVFVICVAVSVQVCVWEQSTSSLAIRISSVTFEKTVGWMKSPGWPHTAPPHSSVAPSRFPLSISSIILSNCFWSIWRKQKLNWVTLRGKICRTKSLTASCTCGPWSTPGSSGFPRTLDLAFSTLRRTNSS